MESVRARNKSNTKTTTGTGKKKKPVLLNLDADSDGSIGGEGQDEEDGGLAEREVSKLRALEVELKSCQACGPAKMCKVNKQGVHVAVTIGMRQAWACALVGVSQSRQIHSAHLDLKRLLKCIE